MSQARLSGRTNRADLRRGSTLLLPIQGVRLSDKVCRRLPGKPDVEFHLAIAEATHNTVMAHIVNSLHGMFLAVPRVRLVVRNPARTQLLVTQHEAALEAIQCRDRTGATTAMVAHLEFIEDEIRRFSGKICRSSPPPYVYMTLFFNKEGRLCEINVICSGTSRRRLGSLTATLKECQSWAGPFIDGKEKRTWLRGIESH